MSVPLTTVVGPSEDPSAAYPATGDKGFTARPLFFVRGGDINSRTLYNAGFTGRYWSSTVQSGTGARSLNFNSGGSYPQDGSNRVNGFSLRWLDPALDQ